MLAGAPAGPRESIDRRRTEGHQGQASLTAARLSPGASATASRA